MLLGHFFAKLTSNSTFLPLERNTIHENNTDFTKSTKIRALDVYPRK